MRALIGIDMGRKYSGVMTLLSRLAFVRAQWRLVHCRASLLANPMSLKLECDDALNLLDPNWQDTRTVLAEAQEQAARFVGGVTACVAEASASDGLLRIAEDTHADLIAIGSNEMGKLGSIILGSTARALAIGSSRSVLVGKGSIRTEGPVRAVFATDHSRYADRCLDQLLEWSPAGLAEITFVTAREMLELSDTVQYMVLMDEAAKEGMTFREYTDRRSLALVDKVKAAGIGASYETREGFVASAIETAMAEHDADLLILGAQGHGFLERLLIGSVALDLVVSSRFSTLLLRVPTEDPAR